MSKIGKQIAKLLWRAYRIKYPSLTNEDLFSILFEDIVTERQKQVERLTLLLKCDCPFCQTLKRKNNNE